MINSWFKMVNFNLEFGRLKLKVKQVKKKRRLLKSSGYWVWVLKVTERFSSLFPRVGEDDL